MEIGWTSSLAAGGDLNPGGGGVGDQLWLDFTVRLLSLLVWIGMQLPSIQHSFTLLPACC